MLASPFLVFDTYYFLTMIFLFYFNKSNFILIFLSTEKVKESNINKMLIAEGRQVLAPVQ